MLMTHAAIVGTDMVLLMMLTLLSMMLLVILMLIFMAHVHLHISLVSSPIHHHLLSLLMTLVVHVIRVVVGCLRYRRSRRGGSVIVVASPTTIIDRGAIACNMALVMALLMLLRVIVWPSTGLLVPVWTSVRHLGRRSNHPGHLALFVPRSEGQLLCQKVLRFV